MRQQVRCIFADHFEHEATVHPQGSTQVSARLHFFLQIRVCQFDADLGVTVEADTKWPAPHPGTVRHVQGTLAIPTTNQFAEHACCAQLSHDHSIQDEWSLKMRSNASVSMAHTASLA